MAFPADPLTVLIELFYDSIWNDITSYVYHRERINITRGFTPNSKQCDPAKLKLLLNNRDGRFSPRNPASPLYGKIGRNTPIRIKVTHNAVTYTRFTGEVTSWPSRWDVSGNDIWVPVEGAGILRRLNRGEKPLRSPLYRATAGVAAGDYVPAAYWPLEDGPNATQAASATSGVLAGTVVGDVSFAGAGDLIGSDLLPTLAPSARINMTVPPYSSTGQWAVQVVVNVPAAPGAPTTLIELVTGGEGTHSKYRVDLEPGSPDQLTLYAINTSTGVEANLGGQQLDGLIPSSNPTESDFYGSWRMFKLGEAIVAGNLTGFLSLTDATGGGGAAGGSIVGGSTSSLKSVVVRGESGTDGISFGHVAVFTDPTLDIGIDIGDNAAAMGGWDGETVEDRFARICRQSQLPYTITGESPARMGPERVVTLPNALRDCEAADQGLLFERRDTLGLQLRTNSSRYNQLPIVLDYEAGHLAPPLDPEPDDQQVANDREVQRRGGSKARRELSSGPLSIQDPPDGVGRYDDTITVDVYADEQLGHIANWRLHIGTWDAERYPAVHVNLAAVPALVPSIATADTGDFISITNLPSWLPPGDAELAVAGYSEKIGMHEWDITFACWAGGPYNVVGVWELMSHELHAAIDSSTTSVDIATTDLAQPLLATTGIGSGYAISVGGEQMQVTAVAASTITYGAVGTVAHGNNASVVPSLPGSLAQGNLMVMLAAIRNSGTGVPNTPSGWYRFPVFPSGSNVQLFGKIAGASESAPTVSFAGGVANADTTAQIIRLAGKWHDVENVLIESNARLNTSAQDIAVPCLPKPAADNCIVLAVGWKQDDWTSVAEIPNMTEIAEQDTTTGDDQGIVWNQVIQTTAESQSATSFVVTGGASAISRAAVLALRCDYQTATVTRAVSGTPAASHSAGDAVTTTRPLRWALT